MTLDISNLTKADVYAAAQDLAKRLERQIAISEALQADVHKLASAPCLECDTVWPERLAAKEAKIEELEDTLHGALLLLDRVDMSELAATPRWSDWISFEKERRQLWETRNRLVLGQNGA
jgi:hypothetical protein